MRQRTRPLLRVGGLMILMGLLSGGARAQGSDKIALSVNGEFVTEAEFYERLQRVRAQDFIASVNPLQMRGENAGQIVLNSLINERLILQWAAKTHQMPTDAEVNDELETLKKRPDVTQAIANNMVKEETLTYDIRVQRARFNLATTAASVTPQEVEAYYKAHVADYTTPERWGLAIIRTAKPPDVAKIQTDLKAGKPFAELAKAYSEDDRTKASGGQLPPIAAKDPALPAPIREAVKTLKIGEVSPPIKIEFEATANRPKVPVWWFVRLTSKEPEAVRAFADVKPQVERLALLERAGGFKVADAKIADYRKQSEIKIRLPGYQGFASPPKK